MPIDMENFKGPDAYTKMVVALQAKGIDIPPKPGDIGLMGGYEIRKKAVVFNLWARAHFWEIFPTLNNPANEPKQIVPSEFSAPAVIIKPEAPNIEWILAGFENVEDNIQDAFNAISTALQTLKSGLFASRLNVTFQLRQQLLARLIFHFSERFFLQPGVFERGQADTANVMNYLLSRISDQEFKKVYEIWPDFKFASDTDDQVKRIHTNLLMASRFDERPLDNVESALTKKLVKQLVNYCRIRRGPEAYKIPDGIIEDIASIYFDAVINLRKIRTKAENLLQTFNAVFSNLDKCFRPKEANRLQRICHIIEENFLTSMLFNNIDYRGCNDAGISGAIADRPASARCIM